MDIVQRILLNLAHIMAVNRGSQTGIVLIAPEDLLLTLFDGIVSPDLLRQYGPQLWAALDRAQQSEAGPWRELSDQVEARAARYLAVEHRLAAVDRTLAELLALCLLNNTALVTSFQIPVSHPEIFRYIHKIQTVPADSQPYTIILGNVARDVTINFGEHDIYLSKVVLRYTPALLCPQLTVYRRSFSEIDGRAGTRSDWPQQASKEYDLQFAETGRIFTRLLELPCSLQIGSGRLSLSEQMAIDVISTQIISPEGELLAECTRVAEQRGTTAS